MGAFSIWHIVILGVIALVLFGGRGKVSDLMGDFGKGINSFKKGLSEPDKEDPARHQCRNARDREVKEPRSIGGSPRARGRSAGTSAISDVQGCSIFSAGAIFSSCSPWRWSWWGRRICRA